MTESPHPVGTVEALWRHPVKAMLGEQVTSARLTPTGLEGDRVWAVRDEQRASIQGGRKLGGLMQCAAALDDTTGAVDVRLPDGSGGPAADPAVAARLGEWLGRPVSLWPLLPPEATEHYRRGAPDDPDLMTELMTIFGREAGEPLPDFGVFPPEIVEFETPPGTYVDCYPLLLMTTSALRSLAEALPGSVTDVRRFRPNLVVDTGDEPGHPEFAWSGRRLAVGGAVLEVVAPCPRCVAITRPLTDGIGEDRAVLRHVVRELDQNVGVYARVLTVGEVATGDAVRLLGA